MVRPIRRCRAMLGLLAMSCVSCRACGTDEVEGASGDRAAVAPHSTEVPAADGATVGDAAKVIASVGTDAAFVVVAWPQRWPQLQRSLGALSLPAPVGPAIDETASVADLPRAVVAVVEGKDAAAEIPTWRGLDLARPVVVGLAAPPVDGPVGAVTPRLDLRSMQLPGLVHRATLPATDPNALAADVGATLATLGEPFAALVEGRSGAKAWRFEGGWIAVLPGADHVRVVAVTGALRPEGSEDIGQWRPLLAVASATPVGTAAMQMLAKPQHAVGVAIRGWRLRALSTWVGAYHGLRALATASSDTQASILSKIDAILLGCEAMLADGHTEIDDWALTVAADDERLHVRAVGSLTPTGIAVLDAGQKPVPMKVTATTLMTAVLALDAEAVLGVASGPPALGEIDDPKVASQAILECGPPSVLGMAARWPFGSMAVAARLAEVPPPAIPGVVQAVVTGIDRDGLEGALALVFDDATALADMQRLVETLGMGALKTAIRERGKQAVLLVGLGVDPATAFDVGSDGPRHGMAYAHLDAKPARDFVRGEDPALAGSLEPLRSVTMWARRSGSGLVIDLVADLGGGAQPPPLPKLDVTWASPQRSTPASEGDPCLLRGTLGVTRALDAATVVETRMRVTVLERGLEEIDDDLGCAARHEPTAPAAADLRRLLVDQIADSMLADLDVDAARQFLLRQCERSEDARICGRSEVAADMSAPELPRLPVDCEHAQPRGDATRIRVSGSSIRVGQKRVEARPEAIAAVLDESGYLDAVSLVVDREVEWSKVAIVIEALVSKPADRVLVAARDTAGEIVWLPTRVARTAGEPPLRAERSAGGLGLDLPPEPERSVADWFLVSLGPNALDVRDRGRGRLRLDPDDPAAVRKVTESGLFVTTYVEATDDVTFDRVVQVLGAACTDAILVP